MEPETFRWDPELGVLWVGDRSYPARFRMTTTDEQVPESFRVANSAYRMEIRAATVVFENQWCLSTIWGDATYSSNSWSFRHSLDLPDDWPFAEEPTLVEVGVLVPEPARITRPAETYDLPSGRVELPERTTTLWGDPLSYVDVPTYHRVAELVMMLPTDIDLPEGEWDSAEGFCDLLITAGLDRTL